MASQLELTLAPLTYDGHSVTIMFGDQDTPITAHITNRTGQEVDLTGTTAYLVVQLPDGRHYYKGTATVSGSTLSIAPDKKQLCQMAGNATAYFVYTQGNSTYATDRFVISIITPYEEVSEVKSYDAALQEYRDKVDTAVQQIDTLAEEASAKLATIDSSITQASDKLATIDSSISTLKDKAAKLHISL